MANPEHQKILSEGVDIWNQWREDNPAIEPDLSGYSIPRGLLLERDDAVERELRKKRINYHAIRDRIIRKTINFSGVNFHRSSFEGGRYAGANFDGADFYEADLSRANLTEANLNNCRFRKAYLDRANLSGATIINSNLSRVTLTNANLSGTRIENCIIYGASIWAITTDDNTVQRNLIMEDTNMRGDNIIERLRESLSHYPFMVDDIEVAQFIHFIRNYKNLGKGLSAMLDKGVLILGKFNDGGRENLEKAAEVVRSRQMIPIIYDFAGPEGAGLIDTVTVLAGISRFVVASLNSNSLPAELERITANFRRPIITYFKADEQDKIYSMFSDKVKLPNVLLLKYADDTELSEKLETKLLEAERNFQQSLREQSKEVEDKWKNA